jgi:hypothetical protein
MVVGNVADVAHTGVDLLTTTGDRLNAHNFDTSFGKNQRQWQTNVSQTDDCDLHLTTPRRRETYPAF